MGMRNPELPEHRGLPLKYTPPSGPVEPVASPSLALPVAAIYVEVSASGQKDGTSREVQVEKCRALLESEGYQTMEEFIYQEACADAGTGRPELARLIAGVCAGRVKALCFHDIGWWSGAVLHWLQLIDGLLSHDVQLRLVEGTLEDSLEGQLFLFVQLFSGKRERLRSIDRMKMGKAAVARMGRLPVGTGAGLYGYDYDRTNRVRVVKEDEATVVRMMFEWASEGVGRYRIAMRLNELGLPTKTGSKWRPQGVGRVLENPAYTGIQFYAPKRTSKVRCRKLKDTANPSSEVIRIDGFTPAIISKELYDLVQDRVRARRTVVEGSEGQCC